MDEFGDHTQSHSNDQSGFGELHLSSGVDQLAGSQQYPQSNYNVGQTKPESQTQQTDSGVAQPVGRHQYSKPTRNARQIQPERQAPQHPLSAMFARVCVRFRGWVQSGSQGSEPQQMIGSESITKYCEEYDKYGGDYEKRLELIRNMLFTIVEQVTEMKEAFGKSQQMTGIVENSQHTSVLQQEKETLTAELKKAKAQVVKLQEQLRGTRMKMVNTAEKRGVLPSRDRAANEHAIRVYFNQKFPAFTDEYGSEATNARKGLTELFVECFNYAREYLAQKMAEAKGYGIHVPKQLQELDDLNTAVQDVHTAEVWVERRADPQFWEQYKAVMELKSTMVHNEKNLKDDLKKRLYKKFSNLLESEQYKCLCGVKHQGDHLDPSTKYKKEKKTAKHSHSDKETYDTAIFSCHETPEKGAMSGDNPHAPIILEGFVTNTIDTIILMLCLPNPIIPSTHLKQFNSEWVTADVFEKNVRTSQLADQPIAAYYLPILLTASAGTDNYRLFLKGNVEVRLGYMD